MNQYTKEEKVKYFESKIKDLAKRIALTKNVHELHYCALKLVRATKRHRDLVEELEAQKAP